jgi:hypothetical protein
VLVSSIWAKAFLSPIQNGDSWENGGFKETVTSTFYELHIIRPGKQGVLDVHTWKKTEAINWPWHTVLTIKDEQESEFEEQLTGVMLLHSWFQTWRPNQCVIRHLLRAATGVMRLLSSAKGLALDQQSRGSGNGYVWMSILSKSKQLSFRYLPFWTKEEETLIQ